MASEHKSKGAGDIQNLYMKGQNFCKQGEYRRAYKYFEIAAKQGHPEAQYNLATLLHEGKGVKKNIEEASKWYKEAAKNGIAPAHHNVAALLAKSTVGAGESVRENEKKAVEALHEAAKSGLANAQCLLGIRYMKGDGVEKDEKQAVEYLKMAAAQNYPQALRALAGSYLTGKGVEQDKKMGIELLEKAAALKDMIAQNNLANFYRSGQGVEQDNAKAAELLKQAMKQKTVVPQHMAIAQYNLAGQYLTGNGVAKDESEAVKLYHKAAKAGFAIAQFNLGILFATGQGVTRDQQKAEKWLYAAAKQGDMRAQYALVQFYGSKEFTHEPRYATEAVGWLQEFAEQGDSEARSLLAMFHLRRSVKQELALHYLFGENPPATAAEFKAEPKVDFAAEEKRRKKKSRRKLPKDLYVDLPNREATAETSSALVTSKTADAKVEDGDIEETKRVAVATGKPTLVIRTVIKSAAKPLEKMSRELQHLAITPQHQEEYDDLLNDIEYYLSREFLASPVLKTQTLENIAGRLQKRIDKLREEVIEEANNAQRLQADAARKAAAPTISPKPKIVYHTDQPRISPGPFTSWHVKQREEELNELLVMFEHVEKIIISSSISTYSDRTKQNALLALMGETCRKLSGFPISHPLFAERAWDYSSYIYHAPITQFEDFNAMLDKAKKFFGAIKARQHQLGGGRMAPATADWLPTLYVGEINEDLVANCRDLEMLRRELAHPNLEDDIFLLALLGGFTRARHYRANHLRHFNKNRNGLRPRLLITQKLSKSTFHENNLMGDLPSPSTASAEVDRSSSLNATSATNQQPEAIITSATSSMPVASAPAPSVVSSVTKISSGSANFNVMGSSLQSTMVAGIPSGALVASAAMFTPKATNPNANPQPESVNAVTSSSLVTSPSTPTANFVSTGSSRLLAAFWRCADVLSRRCKATKQRNNLQQVQESLRK